MGKTNNTIHINGQGYDIYSGAPIAAGHTLTKAAPRTIDGVIPAKHSRHTQPIPATPNPVHSNPELTPSRGEPKKAVRTTATSHQPRTPQPARTLMRHIVKKPAPTHAKHLKSHSPVQPAAVIDASPGLQSKNHKRQQRANKASKSQAISRFSAQLHNSAPPVPAPLAQNQVQPVIRPSQVFQHVPPKTTADLLEKALSQATSHEQVPPKAGFSFKKKVATIGVCAVAAILLVGFVAAQNLPGLRLQIASAKAGFSAALPGYSAPGFHMGSLTYSAGIVAIHYHSNSDERAYTITEKNSAWDSETLRDMFVAKTAKNYFTTSAAGRTVYLYGDNQATWVNSGIWYQVQSNGGLSSRQLIDLASSL